MVGFVATQLDSGPQDEVQPRWASKLDPAPLSYSSTGTPGNKDRGHKIAKLSGGALFNLCFQFELCCMIQNVCTE